MEKSAVLLKIDALKENLSEKEKNVVDYIKENYLHIIRYSIVEFAENVDASEATIVRLCKKLGYKGFQDFKISLAQEAKNPIEYIFEKAEESDSIYDIFCKEIGSIVSTMNYTARVIDKKTLEIVANSIMKARKIVLYGSGNSASVAMDGAHKFLRAGLDSSAYIDSHMQLIIASGLTENDVVIGISHSGSSKCIVEGLKTAKEKGATTICICNYGKSPLSKVADYSLFTASEEAKHRVLALSSRIAQLAIIDSLYIYISLKNRETSLNAMKNIEKVLEVTKY